MGNSRTKKGRLHLSSSRSVRRRMKLVRKGIKFSRASQEEVQGALTTPSDVLEDKDPLSVETNAMADKAVKQERPDEAEISALAAEIAEKNKQKMQQLTTAPQQQQQRNCTSGTLLGYMTKGKPGAVGMGLQRIAPPTSPQQKEDKTPLDLPSQNGKFGWTLIGEVDIPYIKRGSGGERFVSVKMVELKLLAKYLSGLSPDIYSCTCIRSYYITEAEAKLLNDINTKHCDSTYGRDMFSVRDLVVGLEDANEFYQFLDLCHRKLVNPVSEVSSNKDNRCGFVRINNDSVVPYTVKDDSRYVPLFYFEGETETLKQKSATLGPWDLAYLKFCCKVQGIRSELFANDSCQVISLADIKAYFPQGTSFDEYWPPKGVDSQLLVQKNSQRNGPTQSWIKAPSISPSQSVASPVSQVTNSKPVVSQVNSANTNGWPVMNQPRFNHTNANVNSRMQQQQPSHQNVLTSRRKYKNCFVRQCSNTTVSTPEKIFLRVPSACDAKKKWFECARRDPREVSEKTVFYCCEDHFDNALVNRYGQATARPQQQPNNPYIQNNNAAKATNNHRNNVPASSPLRNNTNSNNMRKEPVPTTKSSPVTQSEIARYIEAARKNWNSRYYNSTSAEVIDLSSPPHSPQQQRNLVMGNTQQQLQQAAHQLQQQRTGQVQHTPTEMVTWQKLIPIMETPARETSNNPFKMQKALVSGKMVPCINAKPYVYSELLMTVNDLRSEFFPSVSLAKCRDVLQDVLHVNLYSGNLQQKTVLRDNNKCRTLNEVLPLIQLKDVLQYMPQLKYVMDPHHGPNEAKRARLS